MITQKYQEKIVTVTNRKLPWYLFLHCYPGKRTHM